MLDERTKTKTLTDIAPNTILEGIEHKNIQTSNGPAIVMTVIDTVTKKGKKKRVQFEVMISDRFNTECCRNLPCVLFYVGKKQTKGGNSCHDLRFIKADDKILFHESDDEEKEPEPQPLPHKKRANYQQTEQQSIQQEPNILDRAMAFLNDKTLAEPSFQPCDVCLINGMECYGHCDSCGGHQPYDGSQCDCRTKM